VAVPAAICPQAVFGHHDVINDLAPPIHTPGNKSPQLIIVREFAADTTCAINAMLRRHGRCDGDQQAQCTERKTLHQLGCHGKCVHQISSRLN
jgi:hypothetical protein